MWKDERCFNFRGWDHHAQHELLFCFENYDASKTTMERLKICLNTYGMINSNEPYKTLSICLRMPLNDMVVISMQKVVSLYIEEIVNINPFTYPFTLVVITSFTKFRIRL